MESWGDCLFGDECTIAGPHTSEDCVSVEMMQAYAEEMEAEKSCETCQYGKFSVRNGYRLCTHHESIGGPVFGYFSCTAMRKTEGNPCGPEALLWKERER